MTPLDVRAEDSPYVAPHSRTALGCKFNGETKSDPRQGGREEPACTALAQAASRKSAPAYLMITA
jgi:hypothetical protein